MISINGVEICNLGELWVGDAQVLEAYVGSVKVFPCDGGAPTIYSYETTTPYPSYAVESLAGNVEGRNSQLEAFKQPVESLDANIDLLSGAMSALIKETTVFSPDSMDSDMSLLSGDIKTTINRTTIFAPDGLDSDIAFLGGTMVDVVLRQTVFSPDGVDGNIDLLSGSLV